MLPKLAIVFMAVLAVGLVSSCSKVEREDLSFGSLKSVELPSPNSIPAEYGRFVGVSSGTAATWPALWFEKPDGTITAVGVNWAGAEMLTRVTVVERR